MVFSLWLRYSGEVSPETPQLSVLSIEYRVYSKIQLRNKEKYLTSSPSPLPSKGEVVEYMELPLD